MAVRNIFSPIRRLPPERFWPTFASRRRLPLPVSSDTAESGMSSRGARRAVNPLSDKKVNPMSQKILALAAVLAFAYPAFAEDMQMDMGNQTADHSPSSHAFAEANAKMHKDMMVKMTGNADIDFVRSMIPHHQGAIDMAKIELQYGKDPEIRKLAEGVIKAQAAEIAEMNAWLSKNTK